MKYGEPEQDVTVKWRLEGEGDADAGAAGDTGSTPSDEHADDDDTQHADTDTDRDADDNGDDSKVPAGFKRRFDGLNAKYKAYRDIGFTAEEAKAKLAKLSEYEAAEAEWKRQQEEERVAATRDDKSEQLTDEIIRRIESRRPGFLDEIDASQRDRQLYARAHNTAGREILRTLYKEEFGAEPSDKTLARVVDAVGGDINKDDSMLEAFWDPQLQGKVCKKVFDTVKSELFVPVATALGARDIDKLQQRRAAHLGRATTSDGPTAKPEGFSSKHEVGSPKWLADMEKWEDQSWKEAPAE